MASIVVAGDTSGTVTLAAPAVSGTTTLTLPTTSGTVLTSASTITPSAGTVTQASLSTNVAGNGPAFSAYLSSTQSVSSSTTTKVAFNAETFDTNSNFDSTTNYRFTPTVAGYYQVNAWIYGSGAGFLESYLYKNGSLFNRLSFSYTASVQANGGSCLIYLNGSTDYIEIYTFNTTATTLQAGSTYNYFQAAMVRSA
jgi:hypothetical protein